VGEAFLHPGSHLDLDAGVVLDRPAFADARADLRLEAEGAPRLVPLLGREFGAASAEREMRVEPGAEGTFRTSEGSLALVRIHEVRGVRGGALSEKVDPRAPISVRVEWEVLEPGQAPFPETARIRTAQARDGVVEIEWEGASPARIERRDEESGERKVLAAEAASPFRDSSGREGRFYRYEVFRPLPGGGFAAPARAWIVFGRGGFHGTLRVEGARRTLDLARGTQEGERKDVGIAGTTPRGIHFIPGPGGAIGFAGSQASHAPTDEDPGWIWDGSVHVEEGSWLLVRTPEGRRARLKVEAIERTEGGPQAGRLLFEFLPDFGRRFLDPPIDVSLEVEDGSVRVRWSEDGGAGGTYRVETKRRERFVPVAEVAAPPFEEAIGDRFLLEYRVVFRAEDGRESLPSASASVLAGQGEGFARRAIVALGDPDFFRREEAMGALRLLGAKIDSLLREGTSSEDPEVAQRCSLLLAEREEGMGPTAEGPLDLPQALFPADRVERLRDRERRALAVISGDLGDEARAFLAENDPDALVRRLAASDRFGRRVLDEDAPYALGPAVPYAFDRARFDRGGLSGAPWARLAEEIRDGMPRASSRDAWLLRTVIEVLRDPTAVPGRLDRCELALRCLDGKLPGDADALAAAEAILKSGFDLERARALRLLTGGIFGPLPDRGGRVVAATDEGSLREALEGASPGDEIRLAPGEYGGEGAPPFEVKTEGVRLVGEGEGVRLLSGLRIAQAREVEVRDLAIAPSQGIAFHVVEASAALRGCEIESSSAGIYADRADLLLEDCLVENRAARPQGGYGLHAQRGSFVALRRSLVRGFGGAIYASSPLVVERCVLAGPGTSGLHRTGEAFLLLHETVITGFQRGLTEFASGAAVAVEFDRVERAAFNLGETFLVCEEDLAAFGLVAGPSGNSISGCADALRPR
jgi:hypothetical protein